LKLVRLCRPTDTVVAAFGSPTSGVDKGVLRQGHDVDQGGLDGACPAFGHSQAGGGRIAHSELRCRGPLDTALSYGQGQHRKRTAAKKSSIAGKNYWTELRIKVLGPLQSLVLSDMESHSSQR